MLGAARERDPDGAASRRRDVEEPFVSLARRCREAAGAQQAILLLREGEELVVRGSDPPVLFGPRAARSPLGRGAAGRAAESGQTVYVPDLAEPPHTDASGPPLLSGARSLLAVPLAHRERTVAVLLATSLRTDAFPTGLRASVEGLGPEIVESLVGGGPPPPVRAHPRERPGEVPRRPSPEALALLTHELRAPLTALRGLTETLLRGVGWDDRAFLHEVAARIARATERLERSVSDLRDLAQSGLGGLRIHPTAVDVGSLVRDLTDRDPVSHVLHVEVERKTPSAVCDPGRLEQVLENLLANAQRYSPPGSEITVTARGSDGGVAITVGDRGPGIAREDLDRIFEPFVRLDPAAPPGLGVGLAIARSLTEAMGGRLEATSVPGTGSVFTVTLPAA